MIKIFPFERGSKNKELSYLSEHFFPFLCRMDGINAIIFDLGGVILNINYHLTEKAFIQLGIDHFPELYSQHAVSPLFDALETGKINQSDFFSALSREASFPLTDQQITDAWNAMLIELPTERLALLRQLKSRYRLFLLSNTNAIHLEAFHRMMEKAHGIDSLEPFFDKTYYSHIIGLRKPDTAAFEKVIEENRLAPNATLFVDDTPGNIEGAAKTGLKTHLLEPPQTILDLFK